MQPLLATADHLFGSSPVDYVTARSELPLKELGLPIADTELAADSLWVLEAVVGIEVSFCAPNCEAQCW